MFLGIEKITLNDCLTDEKNKFLIDFGLRVEDNDAKTLNNSKLSFLSNLNQPYKITWGVDSIESLENIKKIFSKKFYETDISFQTFSSDNLLIEFCISTKEKTNIKGTKINSWGFNPRIDEVVPDYNKPNCIDISHIVIETPCYDELINFYRKIGFYVSDILINRGTFLRSRSEGNHHDIFVIKSSNVKINHVAFSVLDIFELISGGIFMENQGWTKSKGLGLHPISSALFWYFNSPFGFEFEYTSNEDFLTKDWKSRNISYSPEIATKWILQRKNDGS